MYELLSETFSMYNYICTYIWYLLAALHLVSTRLSSVLRYAFLNSTVTVALYLLYALDRSLDAAVNICKLNLWMHFP